jgi:hypothetical protein
MPKHQVPNWPPTPDAHHEPGPSYGDCPFRCNSRYRAATRDHDTALNAWIERGHTGPEPAPPEIDPWPGDPVFCRRCAPVIRGALRELPLAHTALRSVAFLTRTASADEERRGRSDAPPSPSPGADHADEITRTTTAWEDDLRRHLRHTAATDQFGDPHATLTAAVEYLNTHWTAMIGREECAADFGQEIWRLHAVALAMVKNKPVRRHLPAPCPSCDTLSLIQEEGIAGKPWYVECLERAGGCGRLYQESEYLWLTQLLTGGHVRKPVAA